MVATANPHAARAGVEILRAGGSALDAAIAAQLVLNLVEPQSSGIGGGAFLMHWNEADRRVAAYDGRETAPAAARADRFLRTDGTPMGIGEAIASGRSVGAPGVLRVLELAHSKHGKLPWRRLFEPALRLADEGFAVSPRLHRICSMPPPSSGGIGVLAILGMLERFPISRVRGGSAEAIHLFAEAGRLAYADRDHYVGDPAFVKVPVEGLIDPAYLRERASLIRPERSMVRAAPGKPAGAPAALGADATVEAAGTSHLSVVDAQGNAVAMTTTVESAFGSRILVHGFLLNNQLTDLSPVPE